MRMAWISLFLAVSAAYAGGPNRVGTAPGGVSPGIHRDRFELRPGRALAAFSSGCFWGTERFFRSVPGVTATAVGYVGGTVPNPSYEISHRTGHLETVLVEFDTTKISYAALLDLFWSLKHPYIAPGATPQKKQTVRSAIWTLDDNQLATARASQTQIERRESHRILTRIERLPAFYIAELYHQQYFEKTGIDGCRAN